MRLPAWQKMHAYLRVDSRVSDRGDSIVSADHCDGQRAHVDYSHAGKSCEDGSDKVK